ncbi:MAG: carboxy terminal-processing peptidase [Lewinella sp.]|nr:carboxy terminal-processing peptidase [Lewinella sp.]
MKLRNSLFLSLAAVLVLAAFYVPQFSNEQREGVLLQTVMRSMDRYHYSPQTVNDEFSEKVFHTMLENFDSGKRFLLQSEYEQLAAYRHDLDDQITATDYTFFNELSALRKVAIDRARGFYKEILAEPFDFSNSESVELDGEKREYSADEAALREYWQQYLEYETLERYASDLEKQAEGDDEELAGKTPEELEADARSEVERMIDRWFKRLDDVDREDFMAVYLNSITTVFDPHSNYYKPIDKENWDIRFSGRLEGIGARLMTDDDYTKVSEVVVGGPAWRGKQLEENDVIMKVGQGDEEPVDIMGMDIDDVVQLVRGDKGTEVRLTVKKVDGTQEVISIIRDVVIIDDSFARSLIIEGAAPNESIGYIYLPSFYADFQDPNGRQCADDVAVEIEKLKDAGVDGMVLDLRNNGGGSLRDVVEMTGFFIEDGPVVQVKARNYEPEVLRDVDPSVRYDGPLVVMVNRFSASASEILAAALQDYGRAVVVGSPSTFGKGTVQRFIDLDRTLRGFDEVKPLGQVKLTIQKFYRINGGSTQLHGVTPDVVLPDSYFYIETGERDQDYPMPWTEIAAVGYEQNVLQMNHLDQIVARSQARTNSSDAFNKVLENAERLRDLREDSTYPLALNDYQAWVDAREAEAKQFEDMFDEVVNPSVVNLKVDLPGIQTDESTIERNKQLVESVQKDVYIHEVLNILHDIIVLEGVATRD